LNDVGEARRILNSFLINIENNVSNSIIIAATNLGQNLDTALFRRFDDIIYFETPEKPQIKNILNNRLKRYNLTKEYSITQLSNKLKGSSFADISTGIDEAIKEMIIERKKHVSTSSILNYILLRTKNAGK
jgi:SpoVK/Ycf46/Vps4 family AAA+-type ATPase